ncbi:MAG: succinate dehydrogenase assembly factor 2 [Gammaproteobacteria bacterium]
MPNSELKKVLWRCRRGTKELDLILGTFARTWYGSLDHGLKVQFDRLLQMQDPRLAEWLCFDQEPDEEVREIVREILQRKLNSGSGPGPE